MDINILCIGDVVGRAGRAVIQQTLPTLIKDHNIEFVVCNAENSAGGSGITPQIYKKLLDWGVDVVTLGDHSFRKRDIYETLDSSDTILRPINFTHQSVGHGSCLMKTKSGNATVAVCSILGQFNMHTHADNPWEALDTFAAQAEHADISIIDFHAETTSEKIAMGWHADGKISIVFGTHTHVPTADAGVLPGGTAFICDIGMTGPYDSVLGRRKDRVVKHMVTQLPQKFDVALTDPRMYALKVTVDTETGKAKHCQLLLTRCSAPSGGPVDNDDFDKAFQRHGKK